MAVSIEDFKIAYMPLPKAACSSVKAALAQIDPAVDLPPVQQRDVHLWHAIYPTRRFRPHRWKAFDAPDWFRFAVVRDPVKRLFSAYMNRVVEMKELHHSRRLRSNIHGLTPDPDPDFFFQNLRLYKDHASVIKHHTMGAWHFIGAAPLRYDRVYRTNELKDLARDISVRTGQDLTFPRENVSTKTLTLDDLSDKTIDALRPFLTQEYAHLSDYYENPLR